ncbi:MAG: phosphoribosylformylglycinamidine cyclo-ligase [Euryarchaeota archaeon]|nr:phosphoribosylformylglycinamidine cyclo-ligase [Euryarchaeota archaeon]
MRQKRHSQNGVRGGYDVTDKDGVDYASSGVDIDLEGKAVNSLVSELNSPPRLPGEIGSLIDHPGGFSGIIDFGDELLAMCTDGVGSKLMLASKLGQWETVPIDCMAMNVNDLLCIGAEPIAFVDYIATPKPDPEVHAALGRGLAKAAKIANVSLAGGETASLPDIVNELDMSGTSLGWLPKGDQLTGESIISGDLLIGIPSSGIHSNGFSLVRKILEISSANLEASPPFDATSKHREIERFDVNKDLTLGEVLLNPTRIYVNPMIPLFEQCRKNNTPCNYSDIKGVAHITGGGLSNLLRLHPSLGYHIDNPLPSLPEFDWLQEVGGVSDYEMARTFNMGMGLCVVVSKESANSILSWLEDSNISGCSIVGHVNDNGHRVTHINPDICFEHY